MTGHADRSVRALRDGGGHEHGHSGNAQASFGFGRAFAVGIGLNVAFVIVEAVYGFLSNSLALVADAGHNLSDVLGLAVAWAAAILGKRAPKPRYTYGMKSSSILAALFNAVILLVAMGAIAWEAVRRFGEPAPVAGTPVTVVAGIGILIPGISAGLFASGREGDLTVKGAFLHMAADAAVSAGVVVAGLLIALTGWRWLDPVTSLLIAAAVVWSTWGLLRDSVRMSLAAVPPGIDPDAVRAHLRGLEDVTAVHDYHVWPMSTTEVALTSHLVRPDGTDDAFLIRAARELRGRFGIVHVTLQVETSETTACALAPDGVV